MGTSHEIRVFAMAPAWLALASLFSACGVEDRNLRTGSVLDDSIAQFAQTVCQRRQECEPTSVRYNYGSVTECEIRVVLQNKWITSLPGVAWSPESFDKCGNRWKGAACDDIVGGTYFAECDQRGTRASGESCNHNYQCTSGLCENTYYECGTCSKTFSEGDTCNPNYGGCGGDLNCESDGVCRKPAALNEACGGTQTCQEGLNCYAGTCASPAGEGESCDTSAGLKCNFSQKALLCDTSTSTCVVVTARTTGQSCKGTSYCESLGVCDTNSETCTAGPSDNGGACDSSNGMYCEWPAVCVDKHCKLPTAYARCTD